MDGELILGIQTPQRNQLLDKVHRAEPYLYKGTRIDPSSRQLPFHFSQAGQLSPPFQNFL